MTPHNPAADPTMVEALSTILLATDPATRGAVLSRLGRGGPKTSMEPSR